VGGSAGGVRWARQPSEAAAEMTERMVVRQGKPGKAATQLLKAHVAHEGPPLLCVSTETAVECVSVAALAPRAAFEQLPPLSSPCVLISEAAALVAVDKEGRLLLWDFFASTDVNEKLRMPTSDASAVATHAALIGAFVVVVQDGSVALWTKHGQIAHSNPPKGELSPVVTCAVETDAQGHTLRCIVLEKSRFRVVEMTQTEFGVERTLQFDHMKTGNAVGMTLHGISFAVVFFDTGVVLRLILGETDICPLFLPRFEPGPNKITCCSPIHRDHAVAFIGCGKRLIAWNAELGIELGQVAFEHHVKDVAFLNDEAEDFPVASLLENGELVVIACSKADSCFASALEKLTLAHFVQEPKAQGVKRERAEYDLTKWLNERLKKGSKRTKISESAWSTALKEAKRSIEPDEEFANLVQEEDWGQVAKSVADGFLFASENPRIVSKLLGSQRADLLFLILIRCNDISETLMVEIIRCILRSYEDENDASLSEFGKTIRGDLSKVEGVSKLFTDWASSFDDEEFGFLLFVVVLAGIEKNDVFMIKALSNGILSKEEHLILLRATVSVLVFFDGLPLGASNDYVVKDQAQPGMPNLRNFLSWASVLLDATMRSLVESGEKSDVETLKSVVNEQCEVNDVLQALQPALRSFAKKKVDVVVATNQPHIIETLHGF